MKFLVSSGSALLTVLLGLLPASAQPQVRTLSGKVISGKLLALTAEEVVQQSDGELVKTPLAQVLVIDLRPMNPMAAETAHTLVRLMDDSQLACLRLEGQGNQLRARLLCGADAQFPLAAVHWLLREAQDPKIRSQWQRLTAQPARRDRLVILRQGELNPLEGVLGNLDPQGKTIQFRPESAEPLAVPWERFHGLIFARTDVLTAPVRCLVYSMEGDVLAAADLRLLPEGLQLTTPAGLKVTLPENALARLDFNRGKLVYLSDLEPVKVVERSRAGLLVRYRRDKNLAGEDIRLVHKDSMPSFAKGLSLHAYTELEYDLGGKYKQFQALLGVDPRTGTDSRALVTIECDGEKRFSRQVDPQALIPISLNVRQVQRLRIIVSSQNLLDLHDHATLAEARVSQ
jgi:hypothetical protein